MRPHRGLQHHGTGELFAGRLLFLQVWHQVAELVGFEQELIEDADALCLQTWS